MKKSPWPLGAALTVLILTGCASQNPGSDQSAADVPSVSPSPTLDAEESSLRPSMPTLEPLPEPPETRGMIVATCTEARFEVLKFDPDSAVSETMYSYPGTENVTFPCRTDETFGYSLTGPRFRQMFSESYDRMATQFIDTANNSRKVGYFDGNTGVMTDISSLVFGDDGFSEAPRNTNALFLEDDLYFFDYLNNKYTWVDPDTGEIKKEIDADGYYDHQMWMDQAGNLDRSYATASFNYTPAKKKGYSFLIDGYDGGQSLSFYGDDGLIEFRHGQLGIQQAYKDDDEAGMFKPLTGKTDMIVETALVDEENEILYFVGHRGQEKWLFQASMVDAEKPQKVSELSTELRYALMEFDK